MCYGVMQLYIYLNIHFVVALFTWILFEREIQQLPRIGMNIIEWVVDKYKQGLLSKCFHKHL